MHESFIHPLHAADMYTFNTETNMCSLYLVKQAPKYKKCDNGNKTLMGFINPDSNYCDCPRTNKAVGREDLETLYKTNL